MEGAMTPPSEVDQAALAFRLLVKIWRVHQDALELLTAFEQDGTWPDWVLEKLRDITNTTDVGVNAERLLRLILDEDSL
jgi:hypothetical protein